MAQAVTDDAGDVPIEATLESYPRAYQHWSAIDEMALRALAHAGASEAEIAERLGRPPLDIRNYRSTRGI